MNILWICYCGRHSFISFLFHWHFPPLRAAFSCCNCYFVAWPGCCDGRSHASNRIFQELLLNFAIFKYLNQQQVGTVCRALTRPVRPDLPLNFTSSLVDMHLLSSVCVKGTYSKFVVILVSAIKFTIIILEKKSTFKKLTLNVVFVVPRIMWSKHVISLNFPHSAQVRMIQRWYDD